MCGIFCQATAEKHSRKSVLYGLKLLEYRGYDAFGIGSLNENLQLETFKSLAEIDTNQTDENDKYKLSIGHTRWATHGVPSLTNTHPIVVGDVAVIHNGIVENYEEIIRANDYKPCTDTDTEIIAYLLNKYLINSNYLDAINQTIKELQGNFAFCALINNYNKIIAYSRGAPLIIGKGNNNNYLVSDPNALPANIIEIIYLQERDIVILDADNFVIINDNNCVQREIKQYQHQDNTIINHTHDNYMHKEIYEQPKIINSLLKSFYNDKSHSSLLDKIHNINVKNNIYIIGCGSAYNAGMIGKYIIEDLTNKTVTVELASEFYLKTPIINHDTSYIFISQSGETADTIAALKYVQKYTDNIISILNQEMSFMGQHCNHVILTEAGPEIAVASTKAFSAQIAILYALAIFYSQQSIPTLYPLNIDRTSEQLVEKYVKKWQNTYKILFIGRGIFYPLCSEAALKVKELSYISAEGLAGGELKHGSLALIDEYCPIVVLAPYDDKYFTKILSNVSEIKARKGSVLLITCKIGIRHVAKNLYDDVIVLNNFDRYNIMPAVVTIQFIAYYFAKYKQCNIDKPRNLAKSVTVE
jgi:glucosamine--fructose-6-phosphate aminotransferase (isomerizing)